MPRGTPRDDIDLKDIVDRWLFKGESMLAIATHYDCAVRTVGLRVERAREMWPDLPWSERVPAKPISPTLEWLTMMDGVRGERESAGSVVNGRRRRK